MPDLETALLTSRSGGYIMAVGTLVRALARRNLIPVEEIQEEFRAAIEHIKSDKFSDKPPDDENLQAYLLGHRILLAHLEPTAALDEFVSGERDTAP